MVSKKPNTTNLYLVGQDDNSKDCYVKMDAEENPPNSDGLDEARIENFILRPL